MSLSFSISCSSSFCMLFLLFVFFLSVCIVYNDTFKVVIGSNFYVFLCLWLEVESEALDVMGVLMKDFWTSNIRLMVKGMRDGVILH
jgi:hypothetical protein